MKPIHIAIIVSSFVASVMISGAVLFSSGVFDRAFEQPFVEPLRDTLLDPDSLELRNVFQNRWSWCGELNARNRMGGYVGWSRFIAVEPLTEEGTWRIILEEQTGEISFNIEYSGRCAPD